MSNHPTPGTQPADTADADADERHVPVPQVFGQAGTDAAARPTGAVHRADLGGDLLTACQIGGTPDAPLIIRAIHGRADDVAAEAVVRGLLDAAPCPHPTGLCRVCFPGELPAVYARAWAEATRAADVPPVLDPVLDCRCPQTDDGEGEGGTLTPQVVTCGTCKRSWCERCHPTPAGRCPFEYEHPEPVEEVVVGDGEPSPVTWRPGGANWVLPLRDEGDERSGTVEVDGTPMVDVVVTDDEVRVVVWLDGGEVVHTLPRTRDDEDDEVDEVAGGGEGDLT